ncbi:MAG: hypothetical protein GY856_48760, partial [bacterium]|nr:hypothetical protein [bacterium]
MNDKDAQSGQSEPSGQSGGAGGWRWFPRRGLGRALLLWFLVLSLVPVTVVSIFSFLGARGSLFENSHSQLLALSRIKTEYISSYFSGMLAILREQSEAVANARFLGRLRAALRVGGRPPHEYVTSFEWTRLTEEGGADLRTFRRAHGLHDVFLIDVEGNILFTVAAESDLGTNILTGPYSDTLFARACEKALATGGPVFSDLERYTPSGHDVAGFLVAAMVDDNGEVIGLLALQVPMAPIDAIMQDRAGLGQTGETYLVGRDLRMRSSSPLSGGPTILGEPVDTAQTRRWLAELGEPTGEAQAAEQVLIYDGPRGRQVLGIHTHLDI